MAVLHLPQCLNQEVSVGAGRVFLLRGRGWGCGGHFCREKGAENAALGHKEHPTVRAAPVRAVAGTEHPGLGGSQQNWARSSRAASGRAGQDPPLMALSAGRDPLLSPQHCGSHILAMSVTSRDVPSSGGLHKDPPGDIPWAGAGQDGSDPHPSHGMKPPPAARAGTCRAGAARWHRAEGTGLRFAPVP